MIGETCDGFILQLADLSIAEWTIGAVRDRGRAMPAAIPTTSRSASPRRPTSARPRTWRTCATSAAGSAGWSATTSPTSSSATASRRPCRPALTDYIKGREAYDYNQHGQAGNTHTTFVPDEIVDRFCILGPVEAQLDKLHALRGPRRRPVRHLPPTRRQGPHAHPVRRARDPGPSTNKRSPARDRRPR